MKKQVVIIHGGDTHKNDEEYLEFLRKYPVNLKRHAIRENDFQINLAEDLGEGYEVIRPEMPNKKNSKYEEWKIWFEKMFQFLDDKVILVSTSLGSIFLAKYLSENVFPKKIKALFLLCGPFSDNEQNTLYSFSLTKGLENIPAQADKIFLYHSKDDKVVPFSEVLKYQKELPQAIVRVFEDRGHFNQEHFPELVEEIKSL